MFRVLCRSIRVRELVFNAKQVVQKIRIHERAEAEFMDNLYGHVLPLASDDTEVIAGFIQKNACHAHLLPQAHAIFQLGRRESYFTLGRWDVPQTDVTIKARSWLAISDGRDYGEGLLVLFRVPRRVATRLSVWEFKAIAQYHDVVCAEHARGFLRISVGLIYQARIAIIDR